MLKTKHSLFIILLLTLTTLVVTTVCYANAAEPPSILIIVPNAPDDLEISIASGDKNSPTYSKARKTDKVLESYYTFYHEDLKTIDDYTLKITTTKSTYELTLERPLKMYNSIFTLNLENRTFTTGKLLSRSIFLISVRIILTLIIESLVFYLFMFRQSNSWLCFFIINLLTQGGLNIRLNTASPLASYLIIGLMFAEVVVFIVESIAFLTLLKEHSKLRIFLYVLTSNLLSLILGGYLITLMPI